MLWVYKMEQKFGKYAIENLTKYLIICYAIGYVIEFLAVYVNPIFVVIENYLYLDIYCILHGQIWRLFTWLLIPPSGLTRNGFDLFVLVMLYCYFNIGTVLERTWGTFKYNLFMFGGFLFTILGAILLFVGLNYGMEALTGGAFTAQEIGYLCRSSFSTYYVSMSIFLAFAMTFPDTEFRFMFVIPIKAKILGLFYIGIMAYEIFIAFASSVIIGLMYATVIIFSLFNVLVFYIVTRKGFRTPGQYKRQKQYERQVSRMKAVSRHKCAICGCTEESDPDETFRFCSKCEGSYEYCSHHIYTHIHVKADNIIDM